MVPLWVIQPYCMINTHMLTTVTGGGLRREVVVHVHDTVSTCVVEHPHERPKVLFPQPSRPGVARTTQLPEGLRKPHTERRRWWRHRRQGYGTDRSRSGCLRASCASTPGVSSPRPAEFSREPRSRSVTLTALGDDATVP